MTVKRESRLTRQRGAICSGYDDGAHCEATDKHRAGLKALLQGLCTQCLGKKDDAF